MLYFEPVKIDKLEKSYFVSGGFSVCSNPLTQNYLISDHSIYLFLTKVWSSSEKLKKRICYKF